MLAFCRKWHFVELSLFGSILRSDFSPASDIDILIRFGEGHTLTLDSYADTRDELSAPFNNRDIDLVDECRLADPYRRHEILRTRALLSAPIGC